MGSLKVEPKGDREIVMTRVFAAPRKMVFDALTKPELVQRWLHGPDGWTMPVCEIDLRVGGAYRYVWRTASSQSALPGVPGLNQEGTEMAMGGVFREIKAPERLVATGKFDQPWYPGEELSTWVLTEKAGKTTMTHTVQYQSREARDAVLAAGAMEGVEMGYDRLEKVLQS